jgi:hypothetical protein
MNPHAPQERRKGYDNEYDHTETHDSAARKAAAGAPGAPVPASAKNPASQKKGAPQRQKKAADGRSKAAPKRKRQVAKAAKPARAKKAAASRAESKGAKVLALIGRSKGATLAELLKTNGWLAHSVRGFLSTAAKKHRLQIESTKTESGDRLYRTRRPACPPPPKRAPRAACCAATAAG